MFSRKPYFLVLFLIFQLALTFNCQAETFTQTDWSGGEGQDSWEDQTKFQSESGEGLYLNDGKLRMKINADVVIGQEDFESGEI